MEKEFNVRELTPKEMEETNGGFILLTILFATWLAFKMVDVVIDAEQTYYHPENGSGFDPLFE